MTTNTRKPLLVRGADGRLKTFHELSAAEIRAALSPAKLEQIRAKLGIRPATAKAPAKPAAQRYQTTAEAAAHLRTTIAASRGLPQPVASTAPAKPATPSRSAAEGWQRAAAHQNALAGLDQAPAPLPYAGEAGWKRAAARENARHGL